jgi:hypothetical protein
MTTRAVRTEAQHGEMSMKKLLVVLVAGTMVFAMGACGKKSSDAAAQPGSAMPKDEAKALDAAKTEAKAVVDEAKKTADEAKKVVEEKK